MRWSRKYKENPFRHNDPIPINREVAESLLKLKASGRKVYLFLVAYGVFSDGKVYIDTEKLMYECEFKTEKSMFTGIGDLINRDILARCDEPFEYWYNPKHIKDYGRL